jgi:hypothetical protein
MDANAVRARVNEHPEGVEIRMIDGTVYVVPHRDYVWFTRLYGQPESRGGRYATSFWLHDAKADTARLVNSMLVADITPLARNGGGKPGGRPRKSKG